MSNESLARHALDEFQQEYPQSVVGRAHRVFVGRVEIAVIETRPRGGERRRFVIDVINRVGVPSRYHYAINESGDVERRMED